MPLRRPALVSLLLAGITGITACAGDDDATTSPSPDAATDPTGDGGAPPLPPGAWTEAGLDPATATADPFGCAAGSLAGRRYLYVSATAAAGGTGTRTSPLRSLAAAVSSVTAGDRAILCIAAGDYPETLSAPGDVAADDRTYTLAGGYAADFTTRDALTHRTHVHAADPAGPAVITFGNVRGLVLDGLELSGGGHGVEIRGGYSPGRDVTIHNCHVHDNGQDIAGDGQGGGLLLSGSRIDITHSLIEQNHAGRLGGGIFIGGPASSEENRLAGDGTLVLGDSLARISASVIRGNTLRYDTPHGVGLHLAMNSEVTGNVIRDNHGHGVPGGGDAVGGGLILDAPQATGLIANNWFEANVAEKYGAGVFIDEASIATVVNDVFVDNVGEAQIGVDGRASGDADTDRSYLTVINVTIIGGTGPALAAQDATLHVFNTLCDTDAGAELAARTGGALDELIFLDATSCVGIDGDASAVTSGAHPATCAPTFVDAAASDYRLTPSSSCAALGLTSFTPARIHTGAWSAPPATDAVGLTRPSPPALGAFEPAR